VDAPPEVCPAGYHFADGDVPGWDQFGREMDNKRDTLKLCAADCNDRANCLSFEWSPTSKQCNLNQVLHPSLSRFEDFIFCQSRKDTVIEQLQASVQERDGRIRELEHALSLSQVHDPQMEDMQFMEPIAARLSPVSDEHVTELMQLPSVGIGKLDTAATTHAEAKANVPVGIAKADGEGSQARRRGDALAQRRLWRNSGESHRPVAGPLWNITDAAAMGASGSYILAQLSSNGPSRYLGCDEHSGHARLSEVKVPWKIVAVNDGFVALESAGGVLYAHAQDGGRLRCLPRSEGTLPQEATFSVVLMPRATAAEA